MRFPFLSFFLIIFFFSVSLIYLYIFSLLFFIYLPLFPPFPMTVSPSSSPVRPLFPRPLSSPLLSRQHGEVRCVDESWCLQTCRRDPLARCAPCCDQPLPPSLRCLGSSSSGARGRHRCVSLAPLALKDLKRCAMACRDGGSSRRCLRAEGEFRLAGCLVGSHRTCLRRSLT